MNHQPPFGSHGQEAPSVTPSFSSEPGGEDKKEVSEDRTPRTLILREESVQDFLFDFDVEMARCIQPTILIEDSTGLSPHFVERLLRESDSVYVAGHCVRLLAEQLSKAEVKSARRVWRIAVLVILLGFVGLLTNQLSS